MNRMSKRILSIVLIVAVLLSSSVVFGSAAGVQLSIQYNGEELELTDARPVHKTGMLYLPFRVVMEAMGAEVGWDNGTVTADGGERGKIRFEVGSDEVCITLDGQDYVLYMDEPSFLDKTNSRTYVPYRFFEEILGLHAGFDKVAMTAVIASPATLCEDAVEGKSFKLFRGAIDPQQEYKTGLWNMEVAFEGFSTTDGFITPVSGTMSGVVSDYTQARMVTEMTTELGEYIEGTEPTDEQIAEMLKKMDEQGIHDIYLADLESGNIYIKGLKETDGNKENPWLLLELGANSGLTMDDILNTATLASERSYNDMLLSIIDRTDFNHVEAWEEAKATLDVATSRICDTAFTKDGNVYTLSLDPKGGVGLVEQMTYELVKEGDVIVSGNSYVEFTYADQATGESVKVAKTEAWADGVFKSNVKGYRDGVLVRDMNKTITYTPAEQEPVVTPPAGETVINVLGTDPETPDLVVGGVALEDGQYLATGAAKASAVKPAGGYAYYSDGVLTLNNYSFEGDGHFFTYYDNTEIPTAAAIYCGLDRLDILLEGTSTLTATAGDAIYMDWGYLTIKDGPGAGVGVLNLNAFEDGIHNDFDRTVIESGELNVLNAGRDGIFGHYEDVIIRGGSVNITAAGDGIRTAGYARIDVNGGSLNIVCGDDGIQSRTGNINFAGGESHIDAAVNGIYTEGGDVIHKGGTLTVIAAEDGIYTEGGDFGNYEGSITVKAYEDAVHVSEGNAVFGGGAADLTGQTRAAVFVHTGDILLHAGKVKLNGTEDSLRVHQGTILIGETLTSAPADAMVLKTKTSKGEAQQYLGKNGAPLLSVEFKPGE